jgi:hypothetical protein
MNSVAIGGMTQVCHTLRSVGLERAEGSVVQGSCSMKKYDDFHKDWPFGTVHGIGILAYFGMWHFHDHRILVQ